MKLPMLLCALLLLTTGCGQTPGPAAVPAAPALPTPEEAAVLYAQFLQGGAGYRDLGGEALTPDNLIWNYDLERTMDTFRVRDLTGDGIPELFFDGGGLRDIWTVRDGLVVALEGLGTYDQVLSNGGIFYHRPGGAPTHDDYSYTGLSPESRSVPDVGFSAYDSDEDGVNDDFFVDGKPVTAAEWETVADVYFTLRDAPLPQPDPTFRAWAAALDVDLPPPAMDEDKAMAIFLSYFEHEWSWNGGDTALLRVWDFDGDGIPEVWEDTEPYAVYGVVGLHAERVGVAPDFGGVPDGTEAYRDYWRARG